MGIESKHAYRFVYLKSEKWQNVRLEALVAAEGKCAICGEESIHNDAHHKYYPESFWDTTPEHLIILCRPCHDIVHVFIKNTKRGEEEASSEWNRLITALKKWRNDRLIWLETGEYILSPLQLRTAYQESKRKVQALEAMIASKAVKKPERWDRFLTLVKFPVTAIRNPKPKQAKVPKCHMCHSTESIRRINWSILVKDGKGPINDFCESCATRFETETPPPTGTEHKKGQIMKAFRLWLVNHKEEYEPQRQANADKIAALTASLQEAIDYRSLDFSI